MLRYELLKSVLIVSVASSIVSTSLIQRIKEATLSTKNIFLYGFIISMLIGFSFSLSFSDLNILDSLWVGLISFIGADGIYKLFEDKIFKSNSSSGGVINIERGSYDV